MRQQLIAAFEDLPRHSLAVVALSEQGQYNISLAANMHLNPENWPNTVAVTADVFLIGSADTVVNATRTVLDFGSIVDAIDVKSGATLGFQDLLITGVPWEASNTALTANLPDNVGSNIAPCVFAYPNGTITYNNSDFEMETSALNLTCPEFNQFFINNLQRLGWKFTREGEDVTIYAEPDPIVDPLATSSANIQSGASTGLLKVYGEQTYFCHDTAEERPNAFDADITLVQPSSGAVGAGTAQGSSGLSGGAIAGVVVGSAVGAALLAALGFFVLRRMTRSKASDQKPVKDELLGPGASGGTSSSASRDKQADPQWSYINPVMQLQAAAQASASFASASVAGSNAASSVGHLSGAPAVAKAQRCMMQFDWHVQPHRLEVCGGEASTPIGVGGYGVVYKGQLDGFKPVAIKFLHPVTCAVDLKTTDAFMAEVDVLRACRNKNVVDFRGAWIQENLVYMVLELMETDLLKAIADDSAKAKEAPDQGRQLGWHGIGSEIALDILQGLHYLHSNNVVHLDMKSGNILLARDGTAKIADVGLARIMSKSRPISKHNRGGTLAWQSPEMLMGDPASFSADMWSFGVILLEIVTGQAPERSRYKTPQVPEQCPQPIADLIKACMTPAPTERPSALQAIQVVVANMNRASSNNSKKSLFAAQPSGAPATHHPA
ncbi:hypothetical protein WJX73_002538 [Symbiochloris irregularis]|uniref:Protein kinase domain-containing protein n=1 Tax=Symbiochloris irregularis TaxID=706552 RepID=A0AAW1NPF3_9CHLO